MTKRQKLGGYCNKHYKELLEKGILYPVQKATPFDSNTANRLITQYNKSMQFIGDLLGITRESVRQKLAKNDCSANWKVNNLEEKDKDIIISLLNNDNKNGIKVSVLEDRDSKICLILGNKHNIKVLFDIPEDIEKLVRSKSKHSKLQQEILDNSIVVNVMGQRLLKITNSSVYSKLVSLAKEKGIKTEDYIKLLGYDGMSKSGKVLTDDEVIDILQQYADENNNVSIPCQGESAYKYIYICRRAKEEGMTTEQFIEFFGFKKKKDKRKQIERKGIVALKKELIPYTIKNTNKIKLKYTDPIYKKLCNYASYRKITLEEFLKQIGYEKVM